MAKKDNASDLMMLVMGILIGLGFGLVIYYMASQAIPAPTEISRSELTTYCVREGTMNYMSLESALEIMEKSNCVDEGTLTNKFMCNSVTGTWWVDLTVKEAEGCNPACVVSVDNEDVAINWRCTGLN